ncbi:MAG: hypothetical protein ACTJG2_04005 [Candidatus Saccharimonadales bacterium]
MNELYDYSDHPPREHVIVLPKEGKQALLKELLVAVASDDPVAIIYIEQDTHLRKSLRFFAKHSAQIDDYVDIDGYVENSDHIATIRTEANGLVLITDH